MARDGVKRDGIEQCIRAAELYERAGAMHEKGLRAVQANNERAMQHYARAAAIYESLAKTIDPAGPAIKGQGGAGSGVPRAIEAKREV